MKAKTINKKGAGKTALIALTAITACTFLFSGLTEGVMATEIQKTDIVPTTYSASAFEKIPVPKGYKKSNYTVKADTLPYYNRSAPTTKDLTQEQAAELGAQMLWELYGLDLEGATIYMGYSAATESFPRSIWCGDVLFNSKSAEDRKPQDTIYAFSIDAITGERFSTALSRTLSENASLAFDPTLSTNCVAYEALAKQLAEKCNLVNGPVASTEYSGQGYGTNDPSISIDVTGINGEKSHLKFSRYDKKLLGAVYHLSMKLADEAWERAQAEAAKKNAFGTIKTELIPFEPGR